MSRQYSRLTDHELLPLLKEDGKAAFAELYARYWQSLFSYAARMLTRQEAEDIVQELFTWIWTKKEEITIHTAVSSYLYTALRYRIFDHFDKCKVRLNHSIHSLQQFIDEGSFITDEQVRERELKRIIESGIRSLPSKMREVFIMSRQAHLSQKEIAQKLNISEKTVKKQIGNAIKLLRLRVTSLFFFF